MSGNGFSANFTAAFGRNYFDIIGREEVSITSLYLEQS